MNINRTILLASTAILFTFVESATASQNLFSSSPSPPESKSKTTNQSTGTPQGSTPDKTPNGVISSLPNSDDNFLDDKLLWSKDIKALSLDDKKEYCVPAGARLLGIKPQFDDLTFSASGQSGAKPKSGNSTPSSTPDGGQSPDSSNSPGQSADTGIASAEPYLQVVLDPKGRWIGFGHPQQAMTCIRDPWGHPYAVRFVNGKAVAVGADDYMRRMNMKQSDGDATLVAVGPDRKVHRVDLDGNADTTNSIEVQGTLTDIDLSSSPPLPPGTPVYIDADVAKHADYRVGFDYGLLAVPFKMQMTGKQSFSGSATLGGYIGYRIPLTDLGFEFSPVLFAGASNITVPTAPGSKSPTETAAGFSYGGGFIGRVKESIQVGLVVGFDHVDSAQPYAYNDKPWLSLEIGYSFAQ